MSLTDMQIAELPKDPERLIAMLSTERPVTVTELYVRLSGRRPAELNEHSHSAARTALSFGLELLAVGKYIERQDHRPHVPTFTKIDCHSCGGENPGVCAQARWACGHHCNHSWSHDRCCWCKIEFGENGAETQG